MQNPFPDFCGCKDIHKFRLYKYLFYENYLYLCWTTPNHTTIMNARLFYACGLLPLGCLPGCSPDSQQNPNIVFVLADDLGAECLDVYGGTYGTPNLNRMAEEGIVYENMHSLPLSSPSRVQVMTGKFSYKNYVAFGYMNPDEHTFAHLAKAAGYDTAMIGKWQLGRSRELPEQFGFDYWCLNQLEMYKEFSPSTMGTYTERYANSYVDDMGHYEFALYGPDYFQERVFEYLEDRKDSDRPFFLYYTMPLVHTPHTPTPDSDSWDTDYNGRFTSNTANFPDMVRYMDKQVGGLIDKLKEEGLWDNTILIFVGDNGTSTRILSEMQDGSFIRGGKGATLDCGTNVPLIITYGDRTLPARRSERLVDLVDFMPTFADAMGVEVPEEWDTDGISLYPEICGETPLDREYTICHFNPLWPTTKTENTARIARTARYKLYDDGRFYDAENDPLEQSPIAAGSGTAEEEALREKLQGILDGLPAWTPNETDIPRKGDYGTFYDFAGPQNPF